LGNKREERIQKEKEDRRENVKRQLNYELLEKGIVSP